MAHIPTTDRSFDVICDYIYTTPPTENTDLTVMSRVGYDRGDMVDSLAVSPDSTDEFIFKDEDAAIEWPTIDIEDISDEIYYNQNLLISYIPQDKNNLLKNINKTCHGYPFTFTKKWKIVAKGPVYSWHGPVINGVDFNKTIEDIQDIFHNYNTNGGIKIRRTDGVLKEGLSITITSKYYKNSTLLDTKLNTINTLNTSNRYDSDDTGETEYIPNTINSYNTYTVLPEDPILVTDNFYIEQTFAFNVTNIEQFRWWWETAFGVEGEGYHFFSFGIRPWFDVVVMFYKATIASPDWQRYDGPTRYNYSRFRYNFNYTNSEQDQDSLIMIIPAGDDVFLYDRYPRPDNILFQDYIIKTQFPKSTFSIIDTSTIRNANYRISSGSMLSEFNEVLSIDGFDVTNGWVKHTYELGFENIPLCNIILNFNNFRAFTGACSEDYSLEQSLEYNKTVLYYKWDVYKNNVLIDSYTNSISSKDEALNSGTRVNIEDMYFERRGMSTFNTVPAGNTGLIDITSTDTIRIEIQHKVESYLDLRYTEYNYEVNDFLLSYVQKNTEVISNIYIVPTISVPSFNNETCDYIINEADSSYEAPNITFHAGFVSNYTNEIVSVTDCSSRNVYNEVYGSWVAGNPRPDFSTMIQIYPEL